MITVYQRLDIIERLWSECTRCALHKTRNKMAFWRGSPEAKIAIIGEAPGSDEDEKGLPFVGRAGRKMDELLREAKLDPNEDVFICNILACRPPNNREPLVDEAAACKTRLHAMLWAVQPRILLLVGSTAAKKMAGAPSVGAWRGQPVDVEVIWKQEVLNFTALVTWHPSFLLRTGQDLNIRCQIVQDMKMAREMGERDAP